MCKISVFHSNFDKDLNFPDCVQHIYLHVAFPQRLLHDEELFTRRSVGAFVMLASCYPS